MQKKDPTAWLREYVTLQTALWTQLTALCNGSMGKFLLNVPTHGSVELDGRTWSITKHGLGVLFTEIDGKRQVDMHAAASGPERLDAWRLAKFFGGLGREGEKIITQAVGVMGGMMVDRIQLWLEQLVEKEILVPDGTGYRLAQTTQHE